jgi:predicted chitinase
MLTDTQLQRIMPSLTSAKRALVLPHLNRAMQAHGVDTLLRIAAFVAQLAHESGEFRWMEELWGPTAAQRRYEPPGTLAQRLGNTEVGDGRRFKGRGPIQITGRFNYRKYGELLGLDLLAEPERAATPEIGFTTAGLYWQSNGLNELADQREFVAITRRINGGSNGLAERQAYYERAQEVLGAAVASRDAARAAPLTRGHEAIVADRRTPAKRATARKTGAKNGTARKTAAKITPARHRA